MNRQQSVLVLEDERETLQAEIDARKTRVERNRLGQFATPQVLAQDILKYAATLMPQGQPVRFFDPAIGTGAFYAALCRNFPKRRVLESFGYEVDPVYGEPASRLWREFGLVIELADFTQANPANRFNLVICNPPYVRHHHLQDKDKHRLFVQTEQASGMRLSGLAGLYCYFLGLSHAWMAPGGLAGWLIPSEFMDVNYGRAVKQYLLHRVTLLHIHRFDPNDVQFADALVSSAIVWFRNTIPPRDHLVKVTFGGTLLSPTRSRTVSTRLLADEPKWSRFPRSSEGKKSETVTISDFFNIKRGVATGSNQYFILSEEKLVERRLPHAEFVPILPSPRYLSENEIQADRQGNPNVRPRLFLLDTNLPMDEIRRRYPTLHDYLQEGVARGLHKRYLCRHRNIWYSQEQRTPAPILCTYLGRSDKKQRRPFRFILNQSRATVANVYLAMYPTPLLAHALKRDPSLMRRIWQALNQIPVGELLGEGRVYGGGLHKLEPKELANVSASHIAHLLPDTRIPRQVPLFASI